MDITREQLERMLHKAEQRSGGIFFPGIVQRWEDAVQIYNGKAILYYNDRDGNTLTITEEVQA